MSEFYTNSKGVQRRIADLAYPHALNARDKLVRERGDDDSRDAEIAALTTHIEAIDALATEEAEL